MAVLSYIKKDALSSASQDGKEEDRRPCLLSVGCCFRQDCSCQSHVSRNPAMTGRPRAFLCLRILLEVFRVVYPCLTGDLPKSWVEGYGCLLVRGPAQFWRLAGDLIGLRMPAGQGTCPLCCYCDHAAAQDRTPSQLRSVVLSAPPAVAKVNFVLACGAVLLAC